ncbi:MAG TPA: DEAD/DEAH box helicase [Burkholderiales bacterium]
MEASFQNLGLSSELLRAVAEQGYTQPTPIQAQAIPVVLAGRDLLGAAQTGTGKTAGFTLPMLQLLAGKSNISHSPARHPVRCLVLVPTRELAAQVEESIRTYGKHMKLRTAVIYGGVGFGPQVQELRRGVDIVVATPGRLLDHVEQRTVDLRAVEILVLDEADRMLDMGFIHDIRRILALLPAKRQNLLFSATFPDEVRKLAGGFMRDPVTVEIARRNLPIELIGQVVHPVDKDRKRELLSHLVKSGNWQQVLVFCRTKHGANRLAEQLENDGIETAAFHGNKSQPQRMKALQRFKDCELQVLVATDIAARGIDIESLPHVVNYDLPHVSEDYVHRIGRTGRAGESGQAVSLVSGEDRTLLRDIERMIGKKIESQIVPGFELGAGYHSAKPEPQGRRGQQRQSQPRNSGGQRYGQRNQGNGQRHSGSQGNGQRQPDRGGRPQASAQPRQGQQPRRDHAPGRDQSQGRRPEHRAAAPALPSERVQQSVRQEQLDYHRHQQDDERRIEAAPANDRTKEKATPALFGLVGRKVA